MLFLIYALLLVASASLARAVGPTPLANPLRSDTGFTELSDILPVGYTLGQMKFNGSIGGVNDVKMEGSVEEIIAALKTQHPDFQLEALITGNKTRTAAIAARVAQNKDFILCCPVAGHHWIWAIRDVIWEGIRYLRDLHGLCGVEQRSCVRISCNLGNAIWLCNDNPYPITPDCGYIASYAEDLIRECSHDKGTFSAITCGQEFDNDNYNIVVTKQRCSVDSHVGPDGR